MLAAGCAAGNNDCSFPCSIAHSLSFFLHHCVRSARGTSLLSAAGLEYRGGLDDQHRAHGEGCWLFPDGRVQQQGTFCHLRLTKGFCEWPNGNTYHGEWKNGECHGEGKFICKADGRVKEGTWHDNKLASGRRSWPSGYNE